jgi:hypothetical protein
LKIHATFLRIALGCVALVAARADGVLVWTSDAIISPITGSNSVLPPISDGIDSSYFFPYQGSIEYDAYRDFTVTTAGLFTLIATVSAGGIGGECSVDGLCAETTFQYSASTDVGVGPTLKFSGQQSSTLPLAGVGFSGTESEVLYLSVGTIFWINTSTLLWLVPRWGWMNPPTNLRANLYRGRFQNRETALSC